MAHRRIDCHAHYLSPAYYDALREAGLTLLDGGMPVPQWRVEDLLGADGAARHRDENAVGVVAEREFRRRRQSGAPHTRGQRAGRRLCPRASRPLRSVRDLPMEDVAATLTEIDYAFDTLQADGVTMMTNTGGRLSRRREIRPRVRRAEARKAVVFLHPTSPACFEALALGKPAPTIEFPFDTTRAAMNLVFSGTTKRCPAIKFILPHAGGTLPFWRTASSAPIDPPPRSAAWRPPTRSPRCGAFMSTPQDRPTSTRSRRCCTHSGVANLFGSDFRSRRSRQSPISSSSSARRICFRRRTAPQSRGQRGKGYRTYRRSFASSASSWSRSE